MGSVLSGRLLLLVWSAAVFLLFLGNAPQLGVELPGSLTALALGAASAYGFWRVGFACWRRFGRRLSAVEDPLERSLLELGTGVAIVMALMIAAGTLGLNGPWLGVAVLAGLLVGPQREFLAALRARWAALRGSGGDPVLWVLIIAVGVVTLVQSLTPVTSQDALVYHLAVPAHYVREGGLVRVEGSFFAQFPQNMEMLFTLGLLLDCPPLAGFYHWLLGVGSGAAVAALARLLTRNACGALAAATFSTIPTVALIAGWAYIDLGVVFFVLLSVLAFLRWRREELGAWLAVSAVFAGVAAGCKYTAGLQGLLLVAAVIGRRWKEARSFRRCWGPALLVAATVGLVACPWWIKNVIDTGNPLYPFCYGVFGGDDWDHHRASVLSMALAEWGGSRGIVDTLLLPWRLTMSGEFFSQEGFDGVIGCVFLMAAPLLLAGLRLSREHRVVALLFLLHAAFWVVTTRQVRFLLPALALAAALLGASAPALLGTNWSRSLVGRAILLGLAFNVLIATIHFVHHNPLAVVLGVEPEGQYLRREIAGGDYPVFEHIEEELPEDSYVFFASLGNPGFLCKRRYYADAFFENRTLRSFLRESATEKALWDAFGKRGFTHLLFRWDHIFDPQGRKSDLSAEEQARFAAFLNRHARLVFQFAGTFLYELGHGIGPMYAERSDDGALEEAAVEASAAPGASHDPL